MAIDLISTVTVGAGGSTTINFTSIPSTASDLLITLSGRTTSSPGVTIQLNGSTTGFSSRYLQGLGSGSPVGSSTSNLVGRLPLPADTASTFGSMSIYISNYAGSVFKNYSVDNVTENSGTAAYLEIFGTLWSNTAAITQVTLQCSTFAQYTTASLYTITKGSGGATVA